MSQYSESNKPSDNENLIVGLLGYLCDKDNQDKILSGDYPDQLGAFDESVKKSACDLFVLSRTKVNGLPMYVSLKEDLVASQCSAQSREVTGTIVDVINAINTDEVYKAPTTSPSGASIANSHAIHTR